jgi:hypothetical protein
MPRIAQKLKAYAAGFPERQAGRNRLPKWAVLFQFAVLITSFAGMTLCWIFGFELLYSHIHPSVPHFEPRFPSGGLMAFPGIAASFLLGLIFTNIVLWLVPPARRANDTAFRGVRGGSFRKATGGLLKVAAVVVPICAIISLIGAWEPWAR